MKKINQFFTDHGTKLIIGLLILTYFKTCSIDNDVNRVKKDLRATENSFEVLQHTIDMLPNKNDLRIEGLKSEKRMIQATDRRMLDVRRQSEIEKEIEELRKQ